MHFQKTKTIFITVGIFLALFVFTNKIAQAETSSTSAGFAYQMLESLPGFFAKDSISTGLPQLILAIYKFGIWTVGIAGLFMLTIGGFMYMASAGNNARVTTAKEIITDSLLGIVVAMCAYLILYVINPDLTSLNPSLITAEVSEVTEPPETSGEEVPPDGAATGGIGGSGCGGLKTQTASITSQCGATSPQLAAMLTCMAANSSTANAVITSITDSAGYTNCTPDNWSKPKCAHGKYSCHYGGKKCYSNQQSYAADLSTRNGMSADTLKKAAIACGANYTKDESSSANHVHASVGKSAGCLCY